MITSKTARLLTLLVAFNSPALAYAQEQEEAAPPLQSGLLSMGREGVNNALGQNFTCDFGTPVAVEDFMEFATTDQKNAATYCTDEDGELFVVTNDPDLNRAIFFKTPSIIGN